MIEVTCPNCGETVMSNQIEKLNTDELKTMVARRQTAFDASVSSLTEMSGFAYPIIMPCCGERIITVN